MKFAKILLVFILAVVLIALAVLGYGYWLARRALPQLQGTLHLQGLKSPVTVYRDSIGVPHIYAQSLDDVAFAQGFVTAQDRLWQMDMFRRDAEGELSEVVGPQTLKLDEKHRRLGFAEVAQQAFDGMDPESQQLLKQYAAGVNEFIRTHVDRLPIEFHLLRYQPRPWRPMDSLSIALMMYETLNNTWERDLFRGMLYDKYGPQMIEDLYPTHTKYEIPLVGVDSPSQDDLLKEPNPQALPYRPKADWHLLDDAAVSRPVDPSIADSLLWAASSEKSFEAVLSWIDSLNANAPDNFPGSNNWVVSGSHTVSGMPMLANDPHLAHSVPSIWYQTQLHSPGLDVIGVTIPGAPSIIIGHNARIAWGMTNLNPDVQDVYVEQFDSPEGTQYEVNGQWQQATVRDEDIKIKGMPDEILRVLVTRHGPIMKRDATTGYALKWTALGPNGVGFPFLKLNQASNWHDFTHALKSYGGPIQNIVYADVDGNIGLYDAGKIPIRNAGIGNIPVPGNTDEYEWVGYIPFDQLPHLYDPPDGIIVTANQRITGDSYPFFVSNDWEAPYRFARIHELLTAQKKFTRDDFLKIQGDVDSEADQTLAAFAIRAFKSAPSPDPLVKAAIDRLQRGNYIATPDNAAVTIAESLRWQLEETILSSALGKQWKDYHSSMKPIFIENILTDRPARWLPNGYHSYDELMVRSLERVGHDLSDRYHSTDPSAWRWNHYPLLFSHPLARFWPLTRLLDVGPFEQPGTQWTVKQTTSTIGPSMRMVVDLSDFDHSYNNITLGASGQPFSLYYKDQITHWLGVKSCFMSFSDDAVKKNAVNTLVLAP